MVSLSPDPQALDAETGMSYHDSPGSEQESPRAGRLWSWVSQCGGGEAVQEQRL